MARTSSVYNKPLTGNLGNQTFKDYSGTQVVTSRFRSTSATGSGASYAQRLVRLELPNIVLAGSQLKTWLPCLFEANRFYSNAYTHFISHNKNITLPVQPKTDIEAKRCHWGPLIVSCGSLPPIAVNWDATLVSSSLRYNEVIESGSTTLGRVSTILISQNNQLRPGDFIFMVFCSTTMTVKNDGTKYYTSAPRLCYIQLDPSSTVLVNQLSTLDGLPLTVAYEYGLPAYLAVHQPKNNSAAFVHVRKVGTKYFSSPSAMVLGEEALTYLSDVSNSAWITKCAISYGFKPDII